MDTSGVISELESDLARQLGLGATDPAVVSAGETLLAGLQPALSRALLQLAEQAATEVDAQLPDHEVQVVVTDGEPSISVRSTEAEVSFSTEDLAARLTLRLPSFLKEELEEAADSTGDSINSYVVKCLSSRRKGRTRGGRRISETFQT